MSLIMNTTYHWQLPDGMELYSGDLIELCVNGSWIPGRIEYRPRKHYMLILDDGQEWPITEELNVRWLERKWMA